MQNVSFIFQFPEDREFRFPNVNMDAGPGNLVNFARAINALQRHTASNVLLESRTSLLNQ